MQTNNGHEKTFEVKVGLADMLRGGVIMDVTNADQAKIAEDAGAASVMALERVPADIRKEGGVARMSRIQVLEDIMKTVEVPVMAKVRIGHFVEAQLLEALGVDFIDESEVLTPADEENHIDKHAFKVPFVCGCRNLGEALRRIGEGAAMMRTKGEAGTGNVVEAVRHMRSVQGDMRRIQSMDRTELMKTAKDMGAPYEQMLYVHQHGKLPVPNFAAGGIATPADAAMMVQLGAETVFVGSGIFKAGSDIKDKAERYKVQGALAAAIVRAVTHANDPEEVLAAQRDQAAVMAGLDVRTMPEDEKLATRGW
ncbi:MAG TPA: pyridoxal 5'-phosphate synthase lyase subunit PdxS [Bacteroidetes bacterium]|nr:pyridoxal 5'-phosphate synthase lyase subunit PdxS [Bacteroidota bacterium]HEX04965.1 pyridoxal 5'-phosphate synthase lyase subunit PdxS [Bacteroidota bacterium]